MVLIVMGVSGAGKTTVGEELAQRLGWPFIDGDDYHPQENVEKMRQGRSLTDGDRAPWLARLSGLIGNLIARDEAAVIACSALRASYREQLRSGTDRPDALRFIYLQVTPAEASRRIEGRRGHFMPEQLVPSQFHALEEPHDALTIDATPAPSEVVETILRSLQSSRSNDPE